MIFYPYGSFEIPRSCSRRQIEKDSLREFWDNVADECEGLPDAVGCYILSIRKKGGGPLPWYVGMTEKKDFRNECFRDYKLVHFNSALDENRGIPLLTLIAKLTPEDRYAKPSGNGHKDIQYMEKHLISLAMQCNPALKNRYGIKYLRKMKVYGIFNTPPGRPTCSMSELRRLLRLK